jgi:ubiquinone/menaquinone biosynthesis C-methylase UbiE
MLASLPRVHSNLDRALVPRQRSNRAELLDGASFDPAELAGNFRDIRRVNQLLGGTSAVIRKLPVLFDLATSDRPISILDLATGVADIPLAIADWARSSGRDVRIVASDVSEEILQLACEGTLRYPEIHIARYDARAVPLPDKHADIVLCSLSLHHFAPDDAIQVLREMRRLARVGVVVNDLHRSRIGYAAAWIASRITTRNRLTRNDAPLSVLRAYTPRELADLLQRAGYEHPRISRHPWFRMTAVEIVCADER